MNEIFQFTCYFTSPFECRWTKKILTLFAFLQASEGFWSQWWLWIVTMSLIIATHVCFIILDGAQISKAYRDAEENRKNASETQPHETEMNDLLGGAAWPGTVLQNRIDIAYKNFEIFTPSRHHFKSTYGTLPQVFSGLSIY